MPFYEDASPCSLTRMNSSTVPTLTPVSEHPVTGSIRVWLRLEGFSVLLLAIAVYSHQHASWLLFALLFLAPDLSMLGYLVGAHIGSVLYNSVHSYILPLALMTVVLLRHQPAVLPYALIWLAHIGFDRTLGYGLKYASSFGHTHLGWIGKQKMEQNSLR